MKTVTWGATGTHATLKAAWDGTTFDDDVLFQQVGASTETAAVSYKALNGNTIVVRGNGSLVNISSNMFEITPSTTVAGKLYIEDITASITGGSFVYYSSTASSAYASAELHVRSNRVTMTLNSSVGFLNCIQTSIQCFRYINFYQNITFYNGAGSSFCFNLPSSAGESGYVKLSIEDHIAISTNSACQFLKASGAVPTGCVRLRRIYCTGFTSGAVVGDYAATVEEEDTEIYVSLNDTEVQVANRSIAFDTANFVSLEPTSENYLVPKATSVLYTAATQTSNIAENTVGLNGVATTRHTVGCMSTPPQILPPTGVTVTQALSGVNLSWTNTVQEGFTKSYIYYETANADSLFVTPKASVLSGVTTYTIPYSALVGSERWYVRLAHGA